MWTPPAGLPRIVSLDDHVVEPPNLWVDRLPERYRPTGPSVVRERGRLTLKGGYVKDEDGRACDVWEYEDLRVPLTEAQASAGMDPTSVTFDCTTFDEIRVGCYEPKARIDDMELNHVEGSVCFPNTFTRFCGQTFLEAKDRTLAGLCVRAYNDWMVDEWCGDSDGRLIPLCLVPLWDPEQAVAEVRRNAARGCRAVCFTEIPPYLGLPSIFSGHWDPLFDACAETGTVIFMHIGSGSKFLTTSDDAPASNIFSLMFVNAAMSMTDWLGSGLFERYPTLRVCFAECQVGWIPFLLSRLDRVWSDHVRMSELDLPKPPSAYFRSNVYTTFFDDPHGMRCIDEIGAENVSFETDYPHADSTWPTSGKVVEDLAALLDPVALEQVVRSNAIRLLRLDELHQRYAATTNP